MCTMKRHAFTLTEIMIALALVAFLMVGISYIFAATSKTISVGQSTSGLLRSAKAIQQTMSNDFLGYSSIGSIDASDNGSGLAPLIVSDGTGGAPFLTISNYRVPTYRSEAVKMQSNPPADTTNGWVTRSNAIRIDADGNAIPIYATGDRNFRCDTIGFFASGEFQSQIGSARSSYQSDIRSEESYIWYGHLRVFNSNPANIDTTAAHGEPGMWMTAGNEANRNNRYANQFKLGRYQLLLVDPIDHDADDTTPPVVISPSGDSVPFLPRFWNAGNSLSPFNLGGIEGKVVFLDPNPLVAQAAKSIIVLKSDVGDAAHESTENFPAWPALRPIGGTRDNQAYMGRTDIAATNMSDMRERVRDVATNGDPVNWWKQLPSGWTDRFYTNPFAAMATTTVDDDGDPATPDVTSTKISTRKLAQRQQLLADDCTQLIVEFAGDFAPADGVLDFDTIAGLRQTRWYGLPRDTSGDGTIAIGTGDVLPVASYGPRQSFERFVPGLDSTIVGYPNGTREPTGSSSPSESGYVCVWGPVEFGAVKPSLPMMVRMVVELSDVKGRGSPITQEFVFPVRSK